MAHKEVSNQDDLNVSLDFVKIFDRALPLSSLLGALSHTFANPFSSSLRCKISHALVSLITGKCLLPGQVHHSFETKSGKQAPTSPFLCEGRSLTCQFRKPRWPNQLANRPFPGHFSITYSTGIAEVLQSFLSFVSAANSLYFFSTDIFFTHYNSLKVFPACLAPYCMISLGLNCLFP